MCKSVNERLTKGCDWRLILIPYRGKKILEVAFWKAPVSVLRIILVPGILATDSVSVNRRQLIKGIIQLVTRSL